MPRESRVSARANLPSRTFLPARCGRNPRLTHSLRLIRTPARPSHPPSRRRMNQPVALPVRASFAVCKLSDSSKAIASPHPRMRMHPAFETRRTLPHGFDSDGSFVHGLGLLFKSGPLTGDDSFGTGHRGSFRTAGATSQSPKPSPARPCLSDAGSGAMTRFQQATESVAPPGLSSVSADLDGRFTGFSDSQTRN